MSGLKSKSAAASLEWGAFAPMSPEVEKWQPDPDSIAKAGTLPDGRFVRGKYIKNRKTKYTRQYNSYFSPADSVTSMNSSSASLAPALQGINGWPASEIRASGLPRDIIDTNRPHTLLQSTTSNAPLPTVSESLPTTKFNEFVPPHLRKKAPKFDHAAESSLQPDPAAKCHIPTATSETKPLPAEDQTHEQDIAGDVELAMKLAAMELCVDNPEEGLQLQRKMLNEYVAKSSKPLVSNYPADIAPQAQRLQGKHTQWLKARLVMIMEDDLDLRNRTTRRELMAMSDQGIDQYFEKVASAHKHWWEAEQVFVSE